MLSISTGLKFCRLVKVKSFTEKVIIKVDPGRYFAHMHLLPFCKYIDSVFRNYGFFAYIECWSVLTILY